MLGQLGGRLVRQRDRLPCEGENISTGAVSPDLSWRIFSSSFLKRSFRFRVRSAITSSAPGWRTSSSRPGARASRA